MSNGAWMFVLLSIRCRHWSDVPGVPDHEALRIINGASVAFLNAYIKTNADATAFLNSAPSPGLSARKFRLEKR